MPSVLERILNTQEGNYGKRTYHLCRNCCAGWRGVWYSSDSGARWRRSRMKLPFHAEPGEIQIRSLVVSPNDPNVVYAGSEVGLYRSEDKGAGLGLGRISRRRQTNLVHRRAS